LRAILQVIILLSLNEIDALTDFGLTATQAKAYLCLNFIGPSNASNLAKYSKIPRQDIYRVLNELFEIGIIEKVVKMPNEFKAIPTDKCIALLVKRRNRKTKEFRKTAIENLSLKKYAMKQNTETNSSTIIVQKEESVLLKAEELLSSASKSVFVLSPPQKLYPWIFEHSLFFEKALKKSVQINIITFLENGNTKVPEIFEKFLCYDFFEMRFIPKIPAVSFGLYDNKKIIFEMEVNNGYLESQALVSDNPCLIELALACFKSEWSQARRCDLTIMGHI
jgi:sugar-specific transcriptional regulator TrmB